MSIYLTIKAIRREAAVELAAAVPEEVRTPTPREAESIRAPRPWRVDDQLRKLRRDGQQTKGGHVMYVRITTVQGDPGKLDAAVDYAENTARSAVEATPGNKGFATLTDAASGAFLAASYWDTAENRAASESSLADERNRAGALAGGEARIENYEVAVAQRFSPPEPGAMVRLVRTQGEADRADDAIAFYRNELLPRVQAAQGIISAQLLVDRENGRGLGITAWKDESALDAATARLEESRALATEKLGINFTGIESYTLVKSTAQLD